MSNWELLSKSMKHLFMLALLFEAEARASITGSVPVKPLEFEISAGSTYGIDKYMGSKRIGPAFALGPV